MEEFDGGGGCNYISLVKIKTGCLFVYLGDHERRGSARKEEHFEAEHM